MQFQKEGREEGRKDGGEEGKERRKRKETKKGNEEDTCLTGLESAGLGNGAGAPPMGEVRQRPLGY